MILVHVSPRSSAGVGILVLSISSPLSFVLGLSLQMAASDPMLGVASGRSMELKRFAKGIVARAECNCLKPGYVTG